MQDRIFHEPTHVPKTWLYILGAVAISATTYAFTTGAWKSEMEVRADNADARIGRLADAYLRQEQKIDILLEKTSKIEGQNELILRRMGRFQ